MARRGVAVVVDQRRVLAEALLDGRGPLHEHGPDGARHGHAALTHVQVHEDRLPAKPHRVVQQNLAHRGLANIRGANLARGDSVNRKKYGMMHRIGLFTSMQMGPRALSFSALIRSCSRPAWVLR